MAILRAARSSALVALLAVLLVLTAGPAAQSAAASAKLSAQDKGFMSANAQTDLAEIAMAKIALSRSHSGPVRRLAKTITRDHTKVLHALTKVAKSTHMKLPAGPSPQQRAQAEALKSKPARDFDETYLRTQVNDHVTSVQNTTNEIGGGHDRAVVRFAKSYLPVAKKHLRLARSAVHSVGATRSASAPASNTRPPPSAVVSTGPEAFGAKHQHSDDMWWLVGALVVLFLLVAGGALRLRRRIGARQDRP
jgi:putative membrane protein